MIASSTTWPETRLDSNVETCCILLMTTIASARASISSGERVGAAGAAGAAAAPAPAAPTAGSVFFCDDQQTGRTHIDTIALQEHTANEANQRVKHWPHSQCVPSARGHGLPCCCVWARASSSCSTAAGSERRSVVEPRPPCHGTATKRRCTRATSARSTRGETRTQGRRASAAQQGQHRRRRRSHQTTTTTTPSH